MRYLPSALREKQHTVHKPNKATDPTNLVQWSSRREWKLVMQCHMQEGKTEKQFHYNTEPITSSKTICHNSFRFDLHLHFAFENLRFCEALISIWWKGSLFSSRETWGQTHAAVMRGDDGENFTIKVRFQGGLWCLESALNTEKPKNNLYFFLGLSSLQTEFASINVQNWFSFLKCEWRKVMHKH